MARRRSKRKNMQAAVERFRSQSSDEAPALGNEAPDQATPDQATHIVDIECPHCAETIKAKAKVCKHCGLPVRGKAAKEARAPSGRVHAPSSRVVHHHHGSTANPGTAAIIALFLPGAGHIYAGKLGLGLVYLFLGWPLFVVAMAVGGWVAVLGGGLSGTTEGAVAGFGAWAFLALVQFCVYIWQVVDAYNSCKPAPQSYRRRR